MIKQKQIKHMKENFEKVKELIRPYNFCKEVFCFSCPWFNEESGCFFSKIDKLIIESLTKLKVKTNSKSEAVLKDEN